MMNTYAFEIDGAMLIDEDVAAAIGIADALEDPASDIDPELAEAVKEHGVWNAIAGNLVPDMAAVYEEYTVQLAMEILEDVEGIRFASEFEGSAATIPETDGSEYAEKLETRFDDEFVCVIEPDRSADLFSTAYPSIPMLAAEYRSKLSRWLGERFPYRKYIVKISGTYVA